MFFISQAQALQFREDKTYLSGFRCPTKWFRGSQCEKASLATIFSLGTNFIFLKIIYIYISRKRCRGSVYFTLRKTGIPSPEYVFPQLRYLKIIFRQQSHFLLHAHKYHRSPVYKSQRLSQNQITYMVFTGVLWPSS